MKAIAILSLVFVYAISTAVDEPVDISARVFDLAKSNQLIDKTDLIYEFINSKPVVMLSSPPRFGRSINMELIRKFCNVHVDENGTRLSGEDSDNYNFFKNNNLNIYTKNITFFNKHFGKYPVLYMDFNQLSTESYRSFVLSLKRLVMDVFASHKYLLNSTHLNKYQRGRFLEFYRGKNFRNLEEQLFDSIGILTVLLYINFGETLKSMVLIDNYDAPIQKSMMQENNVLYSVVDGVYRIMKFSLQSNPYLRRTLINNCVKQKKILPTSLFNIKWLHFLNSTYSPFYGFTEDEVKMILEKNKMSDKFNDVSKWYGGYRLKNSTVTMYNPWSVTKYVESKELTSHWGESVYVDKIKATCLRKEIKDKIEDVITNGSTTIWYYPKVPKVQVPRLKEIIDNEEGLKLTTDDIDLFMQFLTDRGYFIILSEYMTKQVSIGVPNEEVLQQVKRLVL